MVALLVAFLIVPHVVQGNPWTLLPAIAETSSFNPRAYANPMQPDHHAIGRKAR